MQHMLSYYQIKVLNTQAICGLVYSGEPATSIIYLYNHGNQYYVIVVRPGSLDHF